MDLYTKLKEKLKQLNIYLNEYSFTDLLESLEIAIQDGSGIICVTDGYNDIEILINDILK